MRPKLTGISVMPSMYMLLCGITGVVMPFQKEKQTPIQWKATTLNLGIIWLGSLVLLAVFHVVHMPYTVPCVCSSIISISAN